MPQETKHGRLAEFLPKKLLKQSWDFTESLVIHKTPDSVKTWVLLNKVVVEYNVFIPPRITGFVTTNYNCYKETSRKGTTFFL